MAVALGRVVDIGVYAALEDVEVGILRGDGRSGSGPRNVYVEEGWNMAKVEDARVAQVYGL